MHFALVFDLKIPNGESINMDSFPALPYNEMQESVSRGISEVKYLCECFERCQDKVDHSLVHLYLDKRH